MGANEENVTIYDKNVSFLGVTEYKSDITFASCIIIVFTIAFFLSLIFNTRTILVIRNTKTLKSKVFSVFIVSLAISDMLSALVSPFYIYQTLFGLWTWTVRIAICPTFWGVKFCCLFVTSLFIMTCVVYRFMGVAFPFRAKDFTLKSAKKVSCAVWATAIIFGSGTAFLAFWPNPIELDPYGECSDNIALRSSVVSIMKALLAFFTMFPLIVITALSIGILVLVRRNRGIAGLTDQRKKQEHQIMIQLCCILFGYYLGYIPFAIHGIFFTGPNKYQDRRLDIYVLMTKEICLRISECSNPFLYTAGSKEMRKATDKYVKELKEKILAKFSRKKS